MGYSDHERAPVEVVRLVNDARVAIGLPPIDDLPPGRTHEGSDCPVYYALGNGDGPGGAGTVDNIDYVEAVFEDAEYALKVAGAWGTPVEPGREMVVRLPTALREFITDFDDGAYPRYVR